MQKPLIATMAMLLFLGACGGVRESRLNPLNWFGRESTETLVPQGGWNRPIDNRALVPVVTDIELTPTSTGALLRATGLPDTQGWWDVELRALNNGRPVDGALVYEFVIAAPRADAAISTEASRLVTAGVAIPASRLSGLRQITVRGATNARTINR